MVISIVVMLGIIFTNSNGKYSLIFDLSERTKVIFKYSRTTGAQKHDNNAIVAKHF